MKPAQGTAGGGTPLSIIHVVAPAPVGGLESVVRTLAAGHMKAGHRVSVMAVLEDDGSHAFVEALRTDGIDVRPVIAPGRAYIRERRFLAELISELRPHVVHTHGFRPDIVDAPVARRLGVATVSTVHGFTGGGPKMRCYEWLMRRAFRRFDAVIAVSRPLCARLIASGISRDRVHEIPNAWAAEPHAFLDRATARQALGIAGDAFALGWIGRIAPEKGIDVFIRSLAQLRSGVDALACILGTGPDEGSARLLAKTLGVEQHIQWHGAVPDAARLLHGFDALVLSSRTEGTPMVLLEAMAAELPIVATSVGGVPDVLGEAEALMVPTEQPAQLARAIEALHADPAMARARASRARELLDRRFAVAPWLDRHETLYRSLSAARSATAHA